MHGKDKEVEKGKEKVNFDQKECRTRSAKDDWLAKVEVEFEDEDDESEEKESNEKDLIAFDAELKKEPNL